MSKLARASHPIYSLLPMEVEGFDALAELALDLRWSWNHAADEVWQQLDPACGNSPTTPGLSCKRFHGARSSACPPIPGFPSGSMSLSRPKPKDANAPAWFQQNHATSPDLRRLFQHGIHVERSPADLFGWAWQCSRRPAQICQRPGRAGGGRGTSLPARLFPAGD